MSLADRIRTWWISLWLSKPPEQLPKPQRPDFFQIGEVSFIDRFAERNSDPDTVARHGKIEQAISNARTDIIPWGRDG